VIEVKVKLRQPHLERERMAAVERISYYSGGRSWEGLGIVSGVHKRFEGREVHVFRERATIALMLMSIPCAWIL
jgi:hypothetical protein